MLSRHNDNQSFIHDAVKVAIYLLAVTTFCLGPVADVDAADAERKYSTRAEKIQLVEQAVKQYHAGDRVTAKAQFEKAASVYPDNYTVPYYLGLINLEEENHSAAITQWKRYVAMDSQSNESIKIRKYITLLTCAQATQNARQAVAQNSPQTKKPTAAGTVAVTAFNNVDYMILGPLGKGIAAMLISDLSRIPGLSVVDRIQRQTLLEEMSLGTSGLVDAETVPAVGKLLQADQVITGRLQDLKRENLQISVSVFDTTQAKIIDNQHEEGALTQFYVLEKKIACTIAEALGKNCDHMPIDFQKVHTNSISALVAYSWGLDHLDKKEYDKAREKFQKALDKDPQFELAEQALLTTPTNAMAAMSLTDIISDISSNAKSMEATGGVSARSEKGGIRKSLLLGGGVAIVGGAVALAGSSGESSPSSPAPSPTGDSSPTNLTGHWSGSIYGGGIEYRFNMNLNEAGNTVTGDINFANWECMPSGTISGMLTKVDGKNILDFSINSQTSTMILQVEADISPSIIDGFIRHKGPVTDTCLTEELAFDCTKN